MVTSKSFTLCTTEREHMIHSVFTTALEGGIGYWSVASTYVWSNGDRTNPQPINEFLAVIDDAEGEDFQNLEITAEVIKRGIRRAWDWGKERGLSEYQRHALRDLRYGKYEDLDFDAETADWIVQFGLFNEIVYA